MLEAIQASVLNPHLEAKDRIKPRNPNEFLPDGFLEKKRKSKPSLRQQLALAAKVFGGKSWQQQ